MKIHHIRNATALITMGSEVLLVDPMLSDVGAFPGFKVFGGGRRRNPLVPLPGGTMQAMEAATAVLITHEHPDHLDKAGIRWIQAHELPVWASPIDAPNLRKKGLHVHTIEDQVLDFPAEVIPARHGRGLLGWLMGPVAGCYLAPEGEPSLYLTSDATLTDSLLEAVQRLRPEVIVAPAGAANMGMGGDILFSVDELIELAHVAPGELVFNHLEAIDHCPTTRKGLQQRLEAEGLGARTHIPLDGEAVEFQPRPRELAADVIAFRQRPTFQKWATSFFTMT